MAWRGWLLFEEHCRRVLFCFVFLMFLLISEKNVEGER